MSQKIGFGLLWLIFVTYAFLGAPPDRPDTFQLIQTLSTGQWAGINPLITALFNLMGIWPLIYLCVLLIDGSSQKIPAWPFALGSFAFGAFALIPYLALRQPQQSFTGPKTWILNVLDSRWTGRVLTLGTIAWLCYGLTRGNWADFVQQWQTSRFIHVMSLDFCLLCLLFPRLLWDDMVRRGIKDQRMFWAVSLLPLLGPLLYLSVRPPLSTDLAASISD
jgi:hypothetical protein